MRELYAPTARRSGVTSVAIRCTSGVVCTGPSSPGRAFPLFATRVPWLNCRISANPLLTTVILTLTSPSHLDLMTPSFECLTNKRLHFLHLNAVAYCQRPLRSRYRRPGPGQLSLQSRKRDYHRCRGRDPRVFLGCKDGDRQGGGVCVFIRSDLAFSPCVDFQNDELECVCLDLLLPKTKPILVGACYRSPTRMDLCYLLEDTLSNCHSFMPRESVLLGDFDTK